MKIALLVASVAALLAACSSPDGDCTLLAARSGIVVDTSALPGGQTGQVCVVDGPCGDVPARAGPLVLPLADKAATVAVEVRLVDRPVEQLRVQLLPVYPNGPRCGAAGHQRTVRLTAGPTTVD